MVVDMNSDLECSICQRSFSHLRSRVRHERDQHGVGGSGSRPPPQPNMEIPSLPPAPASTSPPPPPPAPESPQPSPNLSLTPSNDGTRCTSCNHQYNSREYSRHLPCPLGVNQNVLQRLPHPPLVLRPPQDINAINPILHQLPTSDIMELCRTQNWCLSGYWPLVFVGTERFGSDLFATYTGGNQSSRLLQNYLSVHSSISLPRSIIIEDGHIHALLHGSLLRPGATFHTTETPDNYLVTMAVGAPPGGGGGGGGGDGDGDDSEEDRDEDGDDDSEEDSSEDDWDEDDGEDDDSSDSEMISHALSPGPRSSSATFTRIQHLLPSTFHPGVDGIGTNVRMGFVQNIIITILYTRWTKKKGDLKNVAITTLKSIRKGKNWCVL